jgi:hypothetical protein
LTQPMVPKKLRRLPKKGCTFTIARVAGIVFKIAGGLLLVIGVIGFFIMLVRTGPTLVGSIPYLDQQMAGFIFLISLASVLVFPTVGIVGAVIVGIGFLLGFVGTEPEEGKQ